MYIDPSLIGIRPISSEKQTRPHEHEYEKAAKVPEKQVEKKKKKELKVIPRNYSY